MRHPANRNVVCWRHAEQGELFTVPANSHGFVPLPKRWVVSVRMAGMNARGD